MVQNLKSPKKLKHKSRSLKKNNNNYYRRKSNSIRKSPQFEACVQKIKKRSSEYCRKHGYKYDPNSKRPCANPWAVCYWSLKRSLSNKKQSLSKNRKHQTKTIH